MTALHANGKLPNVALMHVAAHHEARGDVDVRIDLERVRSAA